MTSPMIVLLAGVVGLYVSQQPVIRTTTAGVRLHVIVSSDGHPVTGLSAADFEVIDAGTRQKVGAASIVGHVDLALVLDLSLSVRVSGFSGAHSHATRLVEQLGPEDTAAILTASDRVRLLSEPTRDRSRSMDLLSLISGAGHGLLPRSTVWDAVMAASGLLHGASGVPWVVLFSDGMDNASSIPRTQLEETLTILGTTVDLVQMGWDPGSEDAFEPGLNEPERLAQRTGGFAISASDTRLDARLSARLAELRHAYVITYQPAGPTPENKWRDVRVRVRNHDIRTRPGYFVGTARVREPY